MRTLAGLTKVCKKATMKAIGANISTLSTSQKKKGYDHAQVGLGREFEESVIVPFRYTVIQCLEQDPRPFLL